MSSVALDQYPLLKPFADHGCEFSSVRDDEALSDSPFAPSGRTDKFHVNTKTGAWHDKKLGRGGGLPEFLAAAFEERYQSALTATRLKALANHRDLPVASFKAWADVLGYDTTRDAYVMLCHDPVSGRPCNIYWWNEEGKRWCTTAGTAGLFGGHRLASQDLNTPVYLCEGLWDAVALRHLRRHVKKSGEVVAVPGAGIFKKEWPAAFTGRDVRVCYDHDVPGANGDAAVQKRLKGVAGRLRFLHWPDDTAEGYDIRDAVVEALRAGNERACWDRLQEWLRDEPRVGAPAAAATSSALDDLKREWVYAYETKRFIHLGASGDRAFYELDKESFGDRFAQQFPGGGQNTAAQQMLRSGCRQVARPAYLPGHDQLTTEQVRGLDLPVVNLWIPTDLALTRGDVEPYLAHLAYLMPDADVRRTFLDFATFVVRHPERKPNWAVFLGGPQGIGKDTAIYPVTQAVGRTNFCTPTPDDLEGGYTDWLRHTKVVVVDTLRFHGRRHLMDRLKPWIAAPPERLRINGKYAVQYDIANLVAFFFMANREDALALDPDDRRFFVYWSPAKRKPPRYYRKLWEWLRANVGAVAHYLQHEHQLSDEFDALAPPPMTEAKRHMIQANESPLVQQLRQALEESRPPLGRELVTVTEIQQHLAGVGGLRDLTPHAIGRALKDLGAEKLKTQPVVSTRNGKGTTRPHVWAVLHADRYRWLSRAALSEEFARQRQAGSYRTPVLRVVAKKGKG